MSTSARQGAVLGQQAVRLAPRPVAALLPCAVGAIGHVDRVANGGRCQKRVRRPVHGVPSVAQVLCQAALALDHLLALLKVSAG